MGRLAERLTNNQPTLWINGDAYAARLLAGGQVPWLQVAEFVAWHKQMQGLLKSDVVAFSVAPMIDAWLAQHPSLLDEMRAKPRTTFPLKALLACQSLRDHCVEILKSLRLSYRELPLVIAVPSPRRWVTEAYQAAHDEQPDIGEDDVDSASVYMADFLRVFGDIEIDAVLLEESPADGPATPDEIEWYRPMLNVAAQYRWDVGLHLYAALPDMGDVPALGFVIAPGQINGHATMAEISHAVWTDDDATKYLPHGSGYLKIPDDAYPEAVLEKLEIFRKH